MMNLIFCQTNKAS